MDFDNYEYTILTISDNEEIITQIHNNFYNAVQSYNVIDSPITGDVFDVIEKETPDIIILDINYGYSTKGLDVLFDLRQMEVSMAIPIVILSDDNENIERAVNNGAADFLKVPFDRLELILRIKSILSLFKLIEGITKQSQYLEEQSFELEEQKNHLQEEKEKTDNLLQNILPYEIAEQLKNKGTVKAKKYRMVSIMFSDFKDFTKISSELEPEEIIEELSVFFSEFDTITGEHFIEKIKTIGDAYMAVGGLPLRNKSNPIDVVLASLKIQKFMMQYNKTRIEKGLTPWGLRLGIHTGKVVAGVIGTKKFAYDIWGDAVNTAARLETAGEVNKVNISGVTYSYIQDFFDCTYRGKIPAKNKGDIDMYFVNGLKKEYHEVGDSSEPNQKFMEKLAEF